MALIRWLLSFIERKLVPTFFRGAYLAVALEERQLLSCAHLPLGTCSDNHMRSLVLTAYRVG